MVATEFLTSSYNPAFVELSLATAILASAASLDVADRIGSSAGWLRGVWILAAGVAMGGGTWATHFIALLAFNLPVPIAFDVPTTVVSLVLAVAVTSVAFAIVYGETFTLPRLALGGSVMGVGMVGMHYIGMSAVRVAAEITYRQELVGISLLMAPLAATMAMWIALRITGLAWRLAAAAVMGLAVASVHYMGMAATRFSAIPKVTAASAVLLDRGALALAVAVGAVVILSLALISAAVDRRFAALHQREVAEQRRATAQAEASLAELKAMQASLVQAQKMASLSRLTAGVAHEINTPIGTTLTAATVLQRRTDDFARSVEMGSITKAAALRYAEIARESTDLIVSNVQRAALLIQSFKQVAVDQTSGERREFELGYYLNEVVRSLSPRLKQTLHRVIVDCPIPITIASYPGALAQVVTNLIVNSLVHAFPEGRAGQIVLAARMADRDTEGRDTERQGMERQGMERQGMVELTYSDDGVGIPAANLDRIYDPFFTTSRATGGTGLGLHIVYNIVTQTLGGSIDVDSSANGVRFTMHFAARARVQNEMAEAV